MIDSIGTALSGLRGAREHVNQITENIAQGQIEAENLVDLKTAGLEVKIQTANLKAALEIEETALDILA
ncbi:MAG: hypothetical protein CR997_02450 [Acidobacteria bacterium]|nr:MAG: hypothetical protein CR997_02450 [Acidobacteriota bacterium]